jgi:hypothetical protein
MIAISNGLFFTVPQLFYFADLFVIEQQCSSARLHFQFSKFKVLCFSYYNWKANIVF